MVAPPGTKKKKVKDGSQIASDLDRAVYGLKGGNTDEFWTYQCNTGNWTVATALPTGSKRVKGGGALTCAADLGVFYAFRGNNTREFWVFNPGMVFGSRRATVGESKAIQGSSTVRNLQFALNVSPNPFTGAAVIRYTLPKSDNVSLTLYDVTGKLISTLASGYHPAGSYNYSLLTTHYSLASGVYLLKFETEGYNTTEKLVIE